MTGPATKMRARSSDGVSCASRTLECRGLLAAQAEDGGDAVAGENAELRSHFLLGGAGILALDIGDVRVGIDQTRGDGLSAQVDDPGARAALQLYSMDRPQRSFHPQQSKFHFR